jgi:hypothetical protein
MSADEPDRFLRRAGTGTLPGGWLVTWSVAEGTRGRRWRWTVVSPAGLGHAALVEFDPDGRFGRLELETARGMLTLHPDADRRVAHGNVVRPGGVDPVEVAWSDDDAFAIEEDPFGSAVGGWRGRGWVVEPDLQLRRVDDGDTRALDLDERGIPRLGDAREWPLEI